MFAAILLVGGSISAVIPPSVPRADTGDAPPASFAIRAKKIRLDGERVLDDAVIEVADGRIRAIGKGLAIPGDMPVIEHDGVVSAGLVACHSYSGTRGDVLEGKRAFTPDARIVDTFDPSHPDFKRAIESGITTLVLTPGNGNVASGLSAVVKTSGGRVLAPEAHLALCFSGEALRNNRFPTSSAGAVDALEAAFTKPTGAYELAASGRLPVLLNTAGRDDVQRALDFAQRHKLHGALCGAWLGGDLADAIAKSGLTLIVGPLGPGTGLRNLDSLAALDKAKVPFAFGVDAPWQSNDALRMSAAICVHAGVAATTVWDGLTARGAEVAGVGDHVGKLERGYDADLVLWSGDPLDLTSSIKAVYVDGRLALGGKQ
jgi:imidazolonepropionase-like amidohydrolase